MAKQKVTEIETAQKLITERKELQRRLTTEREKLPGLQAQLQAAELTLADALGAGAGDQGATSKARKSLAGIREQLDEARLSTTGIERRLADNQQTLEQAGAALKNLRSEREQADLQQLQDEFQQAYETVMLPLFRRAHGIARGYRITLHGLARMKLLDPVHFDREYAPFAQVRGVHGWEPNYETYPEFLAARDPALEIITAIRDVERAIKPTNKESVEAAAAVVPHGEIRFSVGDYNAAGQPVRGVDGDAFKRTAQMSTTHSAVQIAHTVERPLFVINSWLAMAKGSALPEEPIASEILELHHQEWPVLRIAQKVGKITDAVAQIIREGLRREHASRAGATAAA